MTTFICGMLSTFGRTCYLPIFHDTVVCSSKIPVIGYKTIWHYNPQYMWRYPKTERRPCILSTISTRS